MNQPQRGFSGLQIVIGFAVIGIASMFAVPQYKAYVAKAKMTEAFRIAGESRRKLTEFHMVNGRFPRSVSEADSLRTTTSSPPEFVRDMVVEPHSSDHDVMVKVFLKDGVVDNPSGMEQFIYIAGDGTPGDQYAVTWSCGASGVDGDLLPENCVP